MEFDRVDEINLFSGASKEDKRVLAEHDKDEREDEAAMSAFKAQQDRDVSAANRQLAKELAGACQRGEQDLKQSSAYSHAGGWSRNGPAPNGPERSASLDTGLGMERDGPDFPK